MAYFTREEYQRKTDWAVRTQMERHDAAIASGMTETQFEACMRLAADRHWFHCNGADALSSDESADSERATAFATEVRDDDGVLASVLDDGSLPYSPASALDILSGVDWDEVWDEDDRQRFIDDECGGDGDGDGVRDAFKCHCHAHNAAIVERIDQEIIAWLRRVDERYGTRFAPSGNARREM